MKMNFSGNIFRSRTIVLSAVLCSLLGSKDIFAQCTTPAPITGSSVLCPPSYTTTLSDATSGGTWSTSDGSNVTVDPLTGVVTGISGGMAVITYMVTGGCYVTFNIGSAAIIGPAAVCSLSTATMSDVFGGGTWSTTSSDITITTGGGIVSVLPGLPATVPATISYIPPVSTGCPTITTTIMVDKTPTITGLNHSFSTGTPCEWESPFELTSNITGGVAPYTYNWWGPAGTFASNSGVVSTASVGHQMGGITMAESGTYYGNVVDHFGCISPTFTGPSLSVIPGPTVYNLNYASGSHAPGCSLILSGSNTYDYYQFGIDGVTVLSSFYGTGSAVTLSTTIPGTYFVVARNPTTTCANFMDHSLFVCSVCKTANPNLSVGTTPDLNPLNIFPNPSNGNFALSGSADFMADAYTVKTEIIDVTGHLVLSQNIPVADGSISQPIHLPADITNGIYFVKVGNGSESQILRLSLNR